MTSMFSNLLTAFVNLFFPPVCHLCREFIPEAGDVKLCADCLEKTPLLTSPLCSCCGRPFFGAGTDHLCSRCITDPPPFTTARSALLYESSTKEMIHQFKYSNRVMLRRPLGLLAAAQLDNFAREFAADLIIPVPLHVRRLRQRGFNQAVLIGEMFSQRWGVALSRNNLRRIRWTEPQVNLSAAERTANVRGAFAVVSANELKGKRIFLVDDVYTTGSTVKECSHILIKAGAAAVAVLTVARSTD